jgi:cbb3-type cytochrome oxidase maturation protein
LILLIAAVAAFFWAVRSGQFDDLESPAWRILLDDDRAPPADEDAHDRK